MSNETLVAKEERLNAALAHLSILLGVFSRGILGVVLAFMIWVTQRGKSPYAARQAMQAVVYQLLGLLVGLIVWLGWGITFAGSVFLPTLLEPSRPERLMAFTMIPAAVLIVIPLGVMVAWVVYGLYAARQTWLGRDFSYPWIGQWIK